MKPVWRGMLAAFGIAGALFALHLWNEYLRAPPMERLSLSTELVALSSPLGREWLSQSHAADYAALSAHFVPQSRKAYCGVATAMTALNATRGPLPHLDERGLFSQSGVQLHPLKVSFKGMSLREFGELLDAHGARVTVVMASHTDLASFREAARGNLSRSGDLLLINYERAHVGQQKMGHISPVAAYHAPTDRLLILDVATHKYPSVWVPLESVWRAMRAPLNPRSTTTRGFVIVHARAYEPIGLGRVSRRDTHALSCATENFVTTTRSSGGGHVPRHRRNLFRPHQRSGAASSRSQISGRAGPG